MAELTWRLGRNVLVHCGQRARLAISLLHSSELAQICSWPQGWNGCFILKTRESKLYWFFFFVGWRSSAPWVSGMVTRVHQTPSKPRHTPCWDVNDICKFRVNDPYIIPEYQNRFPQHSLHYVINHFEQQVAVMLSFSPSVGLADCQEPLELLFSEGCCCCFCCCYYCCCSFTCRRAKKKKKSRQEASKTPPRQLRLVVAGTRWYKGSSKIIRIM